MTEPTTEAGPIERLRQLVLAVARDEPLEVYESAAELSGLYDKALEAARTEGRQQAVREAKERLHEAVLTGVRYRTNRDPDINYLAAMELLDRVAGLNASESGQPPEASDE